MYRHPDFQRRGEPRPSNKADSAIKALCEQGFNAYNGVVTDIMRYQNSGEFINEDAEGRHFYLVACFDSVSLAEGGRRSYEKRLLVVAFLVQKSGFVVVEQVKDLPNEYESKSAMHAGRARSDR